MPVHGFVLAGGLSTRMGTDKARLHFCGRPLIAVAVEKLRGICAQTSIAGNRDDLAEYAPVVHETRLGVGPAAGVESGLEAAAFPWALFIPVDVPLVPPELLRAWVEETLAAGPAAGNGSFLIADGEPQPAFCMLRSDCRGHWSRILATGQRRLSVLLAEVFAAVPRAEAGREDGGRAVERYLTPDVIASAPARLWFCNVNTPQELADAEAGARACGPQTGPVHGKSLQGVST